MTFLKLVRIQSRFAIIMICSLTFLVSCGKGKKTILSDAELKWINVYNENDTLIFRSTKNEFDTSIITKKEIFYPDYNPVEVNDRYLPQYARLWYKNKRLIYHPNGHDMITLIKERPKKKTVLTISYLYGMAMALDISSGSLETIKNGDVYEFNTYHPQAKSGQPKKIFWHEKYGIIKYITHGDETWERINIKYK